MVLEKREHVQSELVNSGEQNQPTEKKILLS